MIDLAQLALDVRDLFFSGNYPGSFEKAVKYRQLRKMYPEPKVKVQGYEWSGDDVVDLYSRAAKLKAA